MRGECYDLLKFRENITTDSERTRKKNHWIMFSIMLLLILMGFDFHTRKFIKKGSLKKREKKLKASIDVQSK